MHFNLFVVHFKYLNLFFQNELSWHKIIHAGSGSQVNSPSLLRVCAMLYGRGSTSHQQVIAVWCETEFHALRPSSPLAPIVKVIRGDIGNGCLGWMKGAFMPKKRSKQWLNRIWTKESALPESISHWNLGKVAASVDFLSRSAWISSAINLLPVMISESWPTYCAFNLNIKTSEDASKQTYKAHCGRPTFNDRGVIKTRTTLEGRILPLICSSQIKIFGSHPKHTELSFWEVGRGLWNGAGHLPSWRNTPQEWGAEEMRNKKWMCLWTVSNNWRKMNGTAAAIIFIALISMAPAITFGIQVKYLSTQVDG